MLEMSPLQQYCQQIDLTYYEKEYGWYYYELALKRVPSEFITSLLKSEMDWRAQHQQNILASTEGEQGSGKSIFNIQMCIECGKSFGNAFNLERDIFSNPQELDADLRNKGETRRTFLYDEQPQLAVGLGSNATRISLRDYEEIGRYTQKNIFYCSPQLYDHSHYFVFKQVDYSINRMYKKECHSCAKYIQCHFNKYETLCTIPFNERDGYPINFRFMLYTKRLSDQVLMPRGIVSMPMIAPEVAKSYDVIKDRNIKSFTDYENKSWERHQKMIFDFINDHEKALIKDTKTGVKVESKEIIKTELFNEFGTNRYLKEEIELFVALIRKELLNRYGKE